MDLLHWLFLSIAIVAVIAVIILSVLCTKRRASNGTLCFVPGKGEPGLFVQLNAEPRLYMNKKTVTFNVKIVKIEDLPDSRNSQFT